MRQMRCCEVKAHAADRQVHEKRETPAVVLTEKAAERRADRIRKTERARKQHLPAQAHDRIGKEVRDRREAGADQHAAADALQRAKRDQRRHRLRKPAQRGCDGEQHDRDDDQRLPAEPVAKTPEHRHRDHRSQQVRRRDPLVQIEAPQVRDDRRQRGADHRLVDRDHHHDARQAEHREQRLPERPDRAACGAGAGRGAAAAAHRDTCGTGGTGGTGCDPPVARVRCLSHAMPASTMSCSPMPTAL